MRVNMELGVGSSEVVVNYKDVYDAAQGAIKVIKDILPEEQHTSEVLKYVVEVMQEEIWKKPIKL